MQELERVCEEISGGMNPMQSGLCEAVRFAAWRHVWRLESGEIPVRPGESQDARLSCRQTGSPVGARPALIAGECFDSFLRNSTDHDARQLNTARSQGVRSNLLLLPQRASRRRSGRGRGIVREEVDVAGMDGASSRDRPTRCPDIARTTE